jgi:hypothetical protein
MTPFIESMARISLSPMLVAELKGNELPYECLVMEIFEEQVANGTRLEQGLFPTP